MTRTAGPLEGSGVICYAVLLFPKLAHLATPEALC